MTKTTTARAKRGPRALFLFALLAFLAPRRAAGEDVAFTAEVDKNVVALDDAVTLRVTLSGEGLDGAKPVPPAMPGFRVSFAGQSQNISFINGRVSSNVSHTYVLQPQAVGRYTIPSFTIQAGGKTYATAPIPVEVTPASAGDGGAGPSSAPPPGGASGGGGGRSGRDLFLTASLEKKTAFVGEPVTLAVRFHSRAQLLAQPAYAPPDTTGFLTEDLPPQRQYVEALTGPDGAVRRYTVVELKTALFPAAPGAATVGSATLECRTEDFSDDGSDDPFGGGFLRNFFSSGRPIVLHSAPTALRVLPLPAEGRPAGFQGDVGQYRLAAALDKNAAALHEPVTLTVTVSGEGNLNALSAPALPPMTGFKAYETLSSLNLSKAGWKVSGSKVFKTILKPEVSGRLEVPRIVFSFFDPEARAYRTAGAGPFTLAVAAATAADAAVPAPAPSAEGLKVFSRDIRYLKTGPLQRRTASFQDSPLFLVLALFPPLGFGALSAARAARRRAAADPAARAVRRAAARAAAALAAAGDLLKEGRPAEAVETLERGLRDYLSAKTSLPAHGLTWKDAAAALTARGTGADFMERFRLLWTDLHGARFSSAGLDALEANRYLNEFKDVLPALEALWKK